MCYIVTMQTWLAPDAFLDTNAHLAWRHSRDVLRHIARSKRDICAEYVKAAESINFINLNEQLDFCSLQPMATTFVGCSGPQAVVFDDDGLPGVSKSNRSAWIKYLDTFDSANFKGEIDLSLSTSFGTTFVQIKRPQAIVVDEFIDLFRAAAEGNAFGTQHQFQLLLDFLDVDPTFERRRTILNSIDININRQALSDFVVWDGRQRLVSVSDLQRLWTDIDAHLNQFGKFASLFDVLSFVREQVSANIPLRTRSVPIKRKILTLTWAPSTCEWVHSFVLWTGISPPAKASETEAINIFCFQRPKTVENYRDYVCRQEDRQRCAERPRTWGSGQNSQACRASNRHFICGRKVGRSALRRSWANCQGAAYQAA